MTQSSDDDDVNDVLASIRRLVAQESQVPDDGDGRDDGDDDGAADRQATPLVLGAAQRVTDTARARDAGPVLLLDAALVPDNGDPEAEAKPAPQADEPVAPLRLTTPLPPPDMPARRDSARTFPQDVQWAPQATPPGPHTEAAPTEPQSSPQDPAAETPFFDEEVLRAMVSEMVREELKGALGERITRNIRKLVRREVLDALERSENDDANLTR